MVRAWAEITQSKPEEAHRVVNAIRSIGGISPTTAIIADPWNNNV